MTARVMDAMRALAVLGLVVLGCLASLCCSCSAPSPLDATGSWSFTLMWGPGDCQLTGKTTSVTTEVTRNGQDYAIAEHTAVLTGSILCTTSSCRMTFVEANDGPPGTGVRHIVLSFDLLLDDHDLITGTGGANVDLESGGTCSQSFTALGFRS